MLPQISNNFYYLYFNKRLISCNTFCLSVVHCRYHQIADLSKLLEFLLSGLTQLPFFRAQNKPNRESDNKKFLRILPENTVRGELIGRST